MPESSTREHFRFDSISWLIAHATETEQGLRLMLRSFALDEERNARNVTEQTVRDVSKQNQEERLQEWATKVGPRRMAELVLDEGELLALRLPQQGARLLDLAYGWFIEANDSVGALITAICSTIATIHANDVAKARDKVRRLIQPSYEHLTERKVISGLPTWANLLAQPAIPDPVLLLETQNSAWEGWLERLVRCVVWTLESDSAEESRKRVQSWLVTKYDERLPLELDLSPIDKTRSATLQVSTLSTALRLFSLGIVGVIAVLLGGAIAFLVKGDAPALSVGFLSAVIGATAAVFAAMVNEGILPVVSRWINSELASHTISNLSITPGPDSSMQNLEVAQEAPVVMRLQQRRLVLRLGWPLLRLLPEVTTEGIGQTRGQQAYRAAAKNLPQEVVEELTELQKRLRSRSLAVPLQIDPSLTAVSWEALLTLALPPPRGRGWKETFQFWRAGESLSAESKVNVSRSSEGPQRVQVLCNSIWSLMVEQGWKTLEQKVEMSDDVFKLPDQKRMTVLHVIGMPVQTSAGLRIQISSTRLRSANQVTSEATVRGAGSLISADSLPLKFVSLVVVQAEPVETLERLDTEREKAIDLRAYAAEVFTAGASAVIMLPALPEKLAERVLAQLSKGVHEQATLDLQHLLTAVSHMRQAIATWHAAQNSDSGAQDRARQIPTDSQLELALDVCLFSRQ